MFQAAGRTALVFVLLYFLYFFGITRTGLLGPDEPRYAAAGREMARSGDWLTPRLRGEPWFEKPPLLYWMMAAGFRAGLGEDLAPRLPVALVSVAFLLFYFRVLEREFGRRAAFYASAILATSAAWLAFSHVAVTDLPMAAAFSAAMLLCLPWVERGERRGLLPAAALMGLAVLAKGAVPLVLALPLLWMGRRRWRDLLFPSLVLLLVAVPWYAVMSARYGTSFLADFFWKHHVERFATEALQHRQPFWFFVPVLLGGVFPWTPALALLFRKALYKDARRKLLLLWIAFGFVFFSAATNKLPGYLLPLVPPLAALLGLALAEAANARWVLAGCGALMGLIPPVGAILPAALLRGISHVRLPEIWPALVSVLGLAIPLWAIESAGRRTLAVVLATCAVVAGVIRLELRTVPVLDRVVSARGLWREVSSRAASACVGEVNRGWRYGLNYYSGTPLPDCAETPRPARIEQDAVHGPRLVTSR